MYQITKDECAVDIYYITLHAYPIKVFVYLLEPSRNRGEFILFLTRPTDALVSDSNRVPAFVMLNYWYVLIRPTRRSN